MDIIWPKGHTGSGSKNSAQIARSSYSVQVTAELFTWPTVVTNMLWRVVICQLLWLYLMIWYDTVKFAVWMQIMIRYSEEHDWCEFPAKPVLGQEQNSDLTKLGSVVDQSFNLETLLARPGSFSLGCPRFLHLPFPCVLTRCGLSFAVAFTRRLLGILLPRQTVQNQQMF